MSFPEETREGAWDGEPIPTPTGSQGHFRSIRGRFPAGTGCAHSRHRGQSHLTQELPAPLQCGNCLGMVPELFAAQHPRKGRGESYPESPFPRPLLRAGPPHQHKRLSVVLIPFSDFPGQGGGTAADMKARRHSEGRRRGGGCVLREAAPALSAAPAAFERGQPRRLISSRALGVSAIGARPLLPGEPPLGKLFPRKRL